VVRDGLIALCTGGSNCAGGDIWSAYFDGTVKDGYLHSGGVSGTVFSSEDSEAASITGRIGGIFTGTAYGYGDDAYHAFVGGFNFMENGNSERWVTGAFLSEREDRLSYGEATSM